MSTLPAPPPVEHANGSGRRTSPKKKPSGVTSSTRNTNFVYFTRNMEHARLNYHATYKAYYRLLKRIEFAANVFVITSQDKTGAMSLGTHEASTCNCGQLVCVSGRRTLQVTRKDSYFLAPPKLKTRNSSKYKKTHSILGAVNNRNSH